jgi:hypothetical protein
MINENMNRPKSAEDPGKKIIKEFGIFVKANEITSEQMREAYYKILGISENETQDAGTEKVLEKNGFKFEGTLKKDVKKDGKFYDILVFAKVR